MIAVTIDCEQWSAPLLRGIATKENNNTDWSRDGNKILFNILDRHNIKATFFVTGVFAEREKAQTKVIAKGHEIGCHGYNHLYRNRKSMKIESNLQEDVVKAKNILEKVAKQRVYGFRAPQMEFSFSLLKVLEKNKFDYDSSLHPRFSIKNFSKMKYPLKPFRFDGMKIKELPVSTYPYLRFPISWTFLRNLGYKWTEIAMKLLLGKGITPVIYFHSWEFTKIKSNNVPSYIVRNTGKKFVCEFEKLLNSFKNEKFITMYELSKV